LGQEVAPGFVAALSRMAVPPVEATVHSSPSTTPASAPCPGALEKESLFEGETLKTTQSPVGENAG
jgi:hypothetical protein